MAKIRARFADLILRLDGDPVRGRWNEASTPSILGRAQRDAGGHWDTRQPPTTTQIRSMASARKDYAVFENDMRALLDTELPRFEAALESAGATWTPGRSRK